MAVIDMKYCTLTIKTGASTILGDVEVAVSEGNFTWTIARNIEYRLASGSLTGAKIRFGDDIPMEISFEADWETATYTGGSGSEVAVIAALTATNDTSDDSSVVCMPASCDIELAYANADCTADVEKTYTFPNFRWESIAFDAGAGTMAVSGKCRATLPTFAPNA